ncbi:ATP-dependent Clp protease ATP-binding subunit [Candidatus Uhrbacteria bacterium]|nr:ATP-dependent Clp protease ATP-binding subunit [Candidatus Uhrbacteria bacterium]
MSSSAIFQREENFTEVIETSGLGDRLQELSFTLSSRIVGQPRALNMVVEKLRTYGAHMNDPKLPAAVIFCLGPTGVGKTEMAKELARCWVANTESDPLTIVQCELYVHGHEISSLVGSPAGYVGYGQKPMLSQGQIDRFHYWQKARDDIEKLAKENFKFKEERNSAEWEIYNKNRPYRSVILFDEIEKGSRELWNVLLHIAGEGRLQMMSGEETSFGHSAVIITSNIGARGISDLLEGRGKVGFKSGQTVSSDDEDGLDQEIYERAKEELERKLPPELMGRLRHDIVVFRRLKRDDYRKILDIHLGRAQNLLIERRPNKPPVLLRYTEPFKDFLIDKAADGKFGARPLKARVWHYVVGPLSGGLLSGEIAQGDNVLFDIRDGRPVALRASRPRKIIVSTAARPPSEANADQEVSESESEKNNPRWESGDFYFSV